jgi:hypothetical protein
MLAVVLLGAKHSGKTTLAKTCLGSSTHTPVRPDSPGAFHTIFPERSKVQILDPKPRAGRTALARQLKKYTVCATLLTLPRDLTDAEQALQDVREWANLSRQLHPGTPLALAVTKTKRRQPAVEPFRFEQLTLATMRELELQQIFYTDADSGELGGVHYWLLDVLHQAAQAANAGQTDTLDGLEKCLLGDDPQQTQRSCDACILL